MKDEGEGPVIRMEQVSKIYHLGEVEVPALRGVDLAISEGEFISIMGPSGSGKSTMLQILGCLDRPTSGELYIDGARISELSDSSLARLRGSKIGFVFQIFNLFPTVTALQNVELPMMILDVGRSERRERARRILEAVGLGDRENHLPSQLSGGQRQRVAIARALANNPTFILADEPTGNLDSVSGEAILEIFKTLNEEGRTIVVVTHDATVAKTAEKIVRMKDGLLEGAT